MSSSSVFALRPATGEDFAFAESIYIEAMRLLMEPLVKWNEVERRAALRRSFKVADAMIIVVGGQDIGWMQVSVRDTDYNLAQLQLVEGHRCKGIGTRLIRDLLDRAEREARTVSLSVVRTNRAIGLYRRLGFRIIDPEATPIIDMVWGDRPPAAGARMRSVAVAATARVHAPSIHAPGVHATGVHTPSVHAAYVHTAYVHTAHVHPAARAAKHGGEQHVLEHTSLDV